MAITWALELAINQYCTLNIPIIMTAVYSIVSALIVYLFDLYKKNILSYILLVAIIPLAALIFWILKVNPAKCLMDYVNWCMIYNGSEELYQASFANFTIFITALPEMILLYLITKRQTAKLVLGAIIIATLLVLCVNRIDVNKATVGIATFYIVTVIVELCGIIYSKKEGHSDKKEGILYLAPICLLLTILSVSMPSKADPIQWTFVKDMYRNISDQIEIWRTELTYTLGNSSIEFTVSRVGYSDNNGNLNNNEITEDKRTALLLEGLSQGDKVYLTGSISDVYTGSSWEKSRKDYLKDEEDYLLDYEELFFAISRQDLEVLQNNRFVQSRSIKINYHNIKTKTFFYPLKTSYYDITSSYHKLFDESAQITFKKARGKGTSYRNYYFDMNLQGEAFQKMLNDADSFSYDNAPQINQETAHWLQDNVFYKDKIDSLIDKQNIYQVLGERAKVIEDRDTTLPSELPDRVKQLAMDITADYDTTYEKLKAIEAYLVKYTYTLSPEKAPKGEDFVDYFLFESKEGYCTSFASAMAVLARCIGVPTRYVEGFVVNCDTTTEDRIYEVKNNRAHAWAEAYIEGIGWIPFEATAPYFNTRYTEWADINKNASGNAGVVMPIIPQSSQPMNPIDMTKYQTNHVKEKINNAVNVIFIFFAVMLSLLLAVIIYYCVLRYRYHKAYQKADSSNKMYLLFLRILQLLKKEGYSLDQQETVLMLSKRVKEHLRYNNVTFREVANIFMRYRYAEKEVTKAQLEQVYDYHLGLSSGLKLGANRLKLWLEEFIFLIQLDRQLKHRYSNT